MLRKKLNKVAIIFDFDGVIINSHKIKTLAFYNIFKSYGKGFSLKAKKFHLDNIGKSRFIKFRFILKKIFKSRVSKEKLLTLDKKFDIFIDNKIKKMTPSKYLMSFLKNKENLGDFYISTGTPQSKIIKILKEKKLIKYFKKVYGSPRSKISHIEEIKKNHNKIVFIGDSFEDFKAAEKTCINFILKYNSENFLLRKKLTVQKINSFKYLSDKLKKVIYEDNL